MAYLTLSIDGTPDDERREAIDEAVRRQRGRAVWRMHRTIGHSYVLIELPDPHDAEAIGAAAGGAIYETAIIAMAVSPTVPQALPSMLEAVGGPGRPAGILACRRCAGTAVIEWDPSVSSAELVLGVIDVELKRFASGRTSELLVPLPPALVTKIAAEGLRAPQIRPDRVLESFIDNV